jgi:hypothetical protein
MKCWDHPEVMYDYNYANLNLNHFSCIDHLLLSEIMFSNTTKGNVISCPDNLSSHLPIVVTIFIQINRSESSFCVDGSQKSIAWNKIDDDNINDYQSKLDEKLGNIYIDNQALSCNDNMCTCMQHIDYIEYQ